MEMPRNKTVWAEECLFDSRLWCITNSGVCSHYFDNLFILSIYVSIIILAQKWHTLKKDTYYGIWEEKRDVFSEDLEILLLFFLM